MHYKIPKTELIQRINEWNATLLQYCDDKRLTGHKREEIMNIYTASPLARYVNSLCKENEIKVKNSDKCSKCKKVTYCSRKC